MLTYIPASLRRYPNWVCWKIIVRKGRPTKVPFDVKTAQWAKADDSTTWPTYEQAVEAADPLNGNDYDGIGFELGGTNFVGIDFDNAITVKGVVDPYALAILKILGNPYTEISPSGNGLHAFVECDGLPKGGRTMSQDHVGIEIYHGKEKGRYFTITGEKFSGEGIPKISDMTLPYFLIAKNKDKKFKALWLGDASAYGGDQSVADFALMCELAKFTNGDASKMEMIFGMSSLGQRDKWHDRDETYRQPTIRKAIAATQTGKSQVIPTAAITFHTPALPDPNGEYVISPVEGQMDGWFPLGDISLIGGASGTGKTTWIFEMLHKQKQGFPVLGHHTNQYMFQVLAYDRGRNAFTRTMRRLNLLPTDIPTTPLPLAFGTEAVQGIINEIEKMNPTPNIIFIEGLDMLLDDANKKSVVSPFMRQLQETAAHFHIALICSVGAPKTKRGEDYAAKRDKLSGSEAWGRNCETVCVLEFSEEDDGTAPQRELTVLPRNAPAEKFTFQFEGGRLVEVAPIPEDAKNPVGRPNLARQRAIEFLERELQNGPKTGKDLINEARDTENISRKVLFEAAKSIGVQCGYQWTMPPMHAVGNN